MKSLVLSLIASLAVLPVLGLAQGRADVTLPAPSLTGRKSVEEAIKARRTVRSFKSKALNMAQLSQLLWSAYGITGDNGLYKSVPSAGALYPLDIWVAAGKNGVDGLPPGVYHYIPKGHTLAEIKSGEVRDRLATAALMQSWIAEAPIVLVVTGEYARCSRKYGERGVRYTHIEAGHAGQNIFLQAGGLGLGAGIVGAFRESLVQEALGISRTYDPILIMPVGYAGRE